VGLFGLKNGRHLVVFGKNAQAFGKQTAKSTLFAP
jgi:hypothetical protein